MLDDFDRFDLTAMHIADPRTGEQLGIATLKVHSRSQCENRDLPCCIHAPSNHRMRTWPMNWRADTGVMERICQHGTGHPDPDHMAYVRSLTPDHDCSDKYECDYPHLEWQGTHGCDGCCFSTPGQSRGEDLCCPP